MQTKYKILKEVEFQHWYLVGDFLNESELSDLDDIVKDIKYDDASIVGGSVDDYRNSQIKWIPFENEWIYDKIWHWANIANDDLWHFDIKGFKDSTQYTSYNAPDGKYDWHLDILGKGINHRKISFVCPLNEGYDGGVLQFKFGKGVQDVLLQKGQAVLFPSFYLHRVTPITKGIRKSLVQWVSGESYK